MQPRQRFDPALLPRIKSPEEMAVTSFLNTGSYQPQVSDDWDEEDWKIAALSDDPLGVREVYEQMRGQQAEQDFIKDISEMDWSSAGAQNRLGELMQRNPRGATKDALDYLDVFRRLGEDSQPREDEFFEPIAKKGSNALMAAREAYAQTGDRLAALAAAEDADRRNLSLRDRNELTDLYGKLQTAGTVPVSEEEFGDPVYNEEKVALYQQERGAPPKTPQQWDEAHRLWADTQRRKAEEAYDAKRRLLEEERYAIPPSLIPQEGSPQRTPEAISASQQADSKIPVGEDGIVIVSSPAELKALRLPSGTKFKTPDGRTGITK